VNGHDRPSVRPVLSQPAETLYDARKVSNRYRQALELRADGQTTSPIIAAENELSVASPLSRAKAAKPRIYGVGIIFNDIEQAGRDGLPTNLAVPLSPRANRHNGHNGHTHVNGSNGTGGDGPTYMIPMFDATR
jgi:hypothetical protein